MAQLTPKGKDQGTLQGLFLVPAVVTDYIVCHVHHSPRAQARWEQAIHSAVP